MMQASSEQLNHRRQAQAVEAQRLDPRNDPGIKNRSAVYWASATRNFTGALDLVQDAPRGSQHSGRQRHSECIRLPGLRLA
jgi:hypothetical protein